LAVAVLPLGSIKFNLYKYVVMILKDIQKYGLLKDEEWEILPWISSPRPAFKIWATPERIKPFFIIEHHPYAVSVLLRIDDKFKINVFNKIGRQGNSNDWEALIKAFMKEYFIMEEYEFDDFPCWNLNYMKFDSDKDIFCIFSQYIDDLLRLAVEFHKMCEDEKQMLDFLYRV